MERREVEHQADLDALYAAQREAEGTHRTLMSERAWLQSLDEMRLDDLSTIMQARGIIPGTHIPIDQTHINCMRIKAASCLDLTVHAALSHCVYSSLELFTHPSTLCACPQLEKRLAQWQNRFEQPI